MSPAEGQKAIADYKIDGSNLLPQRQEVRRASRRSGAAPVSLPHLYQGSVRRERNDLAGIGDRIAGNGVGQGTEFR